MITNIIVSIKEVVKLVLLYAAIVTISSKEVLVNLLAVWLLCQLVGNYLQGRWSDHWKRKQVLIISIVSSLCALFSLYFEVLFEHPFMIGNISMLLWGAFVVDGTLGNTTPIAKAAYLDENPHKSKRMLFANLVFSQAYPWILIPLAYLVIQPDIKNFIVFVIVVVIIGLVLSFLWVDQKDFDPHYYKQLSPFPIKNKYVVYTIISFLISQLVYQSTSYLIEEKEDLFLISRSYILFGLGVALGSLICRKVKEKTNHRKYVSWIFLIAFGFFILKFLSFSWRNPIEFLDSSDLTFLALFSGLYLPSVFAMLSDKAHIHQQGAVCGLLESVMSLGEFIAPYISLCFLGLKYNITFLILGSFLFLAGLLLRIPARFPSNKEKKS